MYNFFIKRSLIKKISLLVASAIVISQLTQILFFEYYLKQSYTQEAITKINHAKNIIKEDMLQVEDEIKKGVEYIDTDELLLSSLYFVNNYQDKQNYNATLLDDEKKRICEQLLIKVKLSLNDMISLYDKDNELIAYVIKTEKGYQQNFISYINNTFTVYSKYENEKSFQIKEFKTHDMILLKHKDYYRLDPSIKSIVTYENINNNLIAKSHRSILENNIIIGHIELSKIHDNKYFEKISKRTDLNILISSTNEKKNFSSNLLSHTKDSFKVQETESAIYSTTYVENIDNKCNIVFELDKKYLEKTISENRKKSLIIGAITITLILFILFIFLKKNLIYPLNRVMLQIKKIESNDYSKTTVVPTKDELEVISENINNLASTIQNREEKIIEEKVKSEKSQAQLYKSEKLASMGEMIGNIAHQWRQPLSVISTAATGMKLQKEFDCLADEVFYKTCTAINENAQYLSRTIEDFRNFIKGERVKSIFKVKDNIQSFLNLVEGSIKNNNIKIVLNLENDLEINGYNNELIQCFINIFNNAKDVLKELDIKNKYIFITAHRENDFIIIKLKDNGNGIPENIISKVFEPYFTTKNKKQGTGLGLHMTYKLIVEGMNGSIEAKNVSYEYNEENYTGAEFSIILPIN